MNRIIFKIEIFILAGILILSTAASIAEAQDIDVPVNVQLPIFIKLFAFDRNFKSKVGNKIRILIIYQEKFRQSLNCKNDIMEFISDNSLTAIQDIPVEFIPANISSAEDCTALIKKYEADIVYLTPLRVIDIEAIASICQSRKIMTISGVSSYIDKGISLSIEIRGEKPSIVINLNSSKKEGSDFSSQILKLARVIN